MLLSFIIIAVLLVRLGLRLQNEVRKHKEAKNIRLAEVRVRQCREIVNFTHVGKTTLHDRLHLRAQPNQRLLKAFGIRSSFTLVDIHGHENFLKKERRLLSGVVAGHWIEQYHNTRCILKRDVKARIQSKRPLLLAQCVRNLCWRVVSAMLFNVDSMGIPEDEVAVVTEEINIQWQRSKCEDDVGQSLVLNSALERVFNLYGSEVTPTEGLALIMPAYETLWRVVLLTFVSAFHRDRSSYDTCQQLIVNVPECLGSRNKTEELALLLAKEGLRMYPSTKRVYRAAQLKDSSPHVSADIESCHRDPAIWGPDALEFRPRRFQQLSQMQKEAYLPFGCRPHLCPAIGGFGERIVTLLVTAFARELELVDGRIYLDDFELQSNCRKPLPTGREDMENWAFYLAAEK